MKSRDGSSDISAATLVLIPFPWNVGNKDSRELFLAQQLWDSFFKESPLQFSFYWCLLLLCLDMESQLYFPFKIFNKIVKWQHLLILLDCSIFQNQSLGIYYKKCLTRYTDSFSFIWSQSYLGG